MAVNIEVVGDELFVNVQGLHKLLAFKGSLTIPLNHISAVERAPEIPRQDIGWKLIGSGIPGLIRAGTYQGKEGMAFWDVSNHEKAIKIDLHDESYACLIVEVEDPDQAIALIRQKIPQ